MARRQAAPKPEELIQKLDDKVSSIKEDIENIIDELKNDVTSKGCEIEENKKIHQEGIVELNKSLDELKKELKEEGEVKDWKEYLDIHCLFYLFLSVKASKEESKEQSNNLKEEVIARLEKTSADIAEVEGRTETSIGAVYGNIETSEEKHAVSIAQLSDSLVVRSVDISTYML